MKIYVGRWDVLPEEWDGVNGLVEKDRNEIIAEIGREIELYAERFHEEDNIMGVYEPHEFEDAFNYDTEQKLDTNIYWIRIF